MRFRKKVVVEAVQYTGPHYFDDFRNDRLPPPLPHGVSWVKVGLVKYPMIGKEIVRPGAWVITKENGGMFSLPSDIFNSTYELVE